MSILFITHDTTRSEARCARRTTSRRCGIIAKSRPATSCRSGARSGRADCELHASSGNRDRMEREEPRGVNRFILHRTFSELPLPQEIAVTRTSLTIRVRCNACAAASAQLWIGSSSSRASQPHHSAQMFQKWESRASRNASRQLLFGVGQQAANHSEGAPNEG